MKRDTERRNSLRSRRAAFGDVLRRHRKRLGLSQEALAKRLDLHRNYISLIERGVQNISLETLFKLAGGLDTRPSNLLRKVEEDGCGEKPPAPDCPSEKYDAEYPPCRDNGVRERQKAPGRA